MDKIRDSKSDRINKLLIEFDYIIMDTENWKFKDWLKPHIVKGLCRITKEPVAVVTNFVSLIWLLEFEE